MKTKKLLSLAIAALLLCGCIVGMLVTGVNAAAGTYTVGDGKTYATVEAALAQIKTDAAAGTITAATIEITGTVSSTVTDGVLFGGVETIWLNKAALQKLPITITGADASSQLNLPADATVASCTNNYTFQSVSISTEATAVSIFAGSGNVAFNGATLKGSGTSYKFYADTSTTEVFAGWEAPNAAITVSMTLDGITTSGASIAECASFGVNSTSFSSEDVTFSNITASVLVKNCNPTLVAVARTGTSYAEGIVELGSGVTYNGTLILSNSNYKAVNASLVIDGATVNGDISAVRDSTNANTHTSNFSITIKSGTVGDAASDKLLLTNLSGGTLNGSASLTVSGGTINSTVYGSWLNTTITGGGLTYNLTGGTFNAPFWASGGQQTSTNKGSLTSANGISVNITGPVVFADNFYGGRAAGAVASPITVTVKANDKAQTPTFNGAYYGGSNPTYAQSRNVASVTNNIEAGTFNGAFYAGSARTGVYTVASITNKISGGVFNGAFFGGTNGALATTVATEISGGTFNGAFNAGSDSSAAITTLTTTLKTGTITLGSDTALTADAVTGNVTLQPTNAGWTLGKTYLTVPGAYASKISSSKGIAFEYNGNTYVEKRVLTSVTLEATDRITPIVNYDPEYTGFTATVDGSNVTVSNGTITGFAGKKASQFADNYVVEYTSHSVDSVDEEKVVVQDTFSIAGVAEAGVTYYQGDSVKQALFASVYNYGQAASGSYEYMDESEYDSSKVYDILPTSANKKFTSVALTYADTIGIRVKGADLTGKTVTIFVGETEVTSRATITADSFAVSINANAAKDTFTFRVLVDGAEFDTVRVHIPTLCKLAAENGDTEQIKQIAQRILAYIEAVDAYVA